MTKHKTIKVILSTSHGVFRPNAVFQKFLKERGYYWHELQARTDEEVIAFVEEHADKEHGAAFLSKYDYEYLQIVEVDTSIPWSIEEYDGAEYIKKLEYEMIDEALNCIRFK